VRKKILLVDDADTVLLMEKMILDKRGYDFVTARDGEEAIQKALEERPDLILMDILMPKMNGVEACKRLRADEATRGIPIIMVTTRGETQYVETSFEYGCNDYVTKPINSQELISKIKICLGE
jgi:CheY-like chemotaxis protein